MGLLVSAPSKVIKLRGDGQQVRAQDNVGQVLDPMAKALYATPIMGAEPPAWILLDILNGYSQTAAPQPATAHHTDALGYVHAKVALTHAAGCAVGTVAFQFPLGSRPSETLTFTGSDAFGLLMAFSVDGSGNFANLAVLVAADQARLVFSFLAEQ